MKDKIWKPIYAIWNGNKDEWVQDYDGCPTIYKTRKQAEKMRKLHFRNSVVKCFVPFLGWSDSSPKRYVDMKFVYECWMNKKEIAKWLNINI